MLAAVVLGLLYVPFLNHGRTSFGSLGAYVQSFRFNDPVFAALEQVSDVDEKKIRGMVLGRFCLADGSIAFLCAGCISMVPPVVAAVHAVDLNATAQHLDSEYHPYVLRLASAHAWTTVDGSCLDYAAGIRVRGHSCDYRFAPDPTIGRTKTCN